jgi:hypothetical protein
MRLALRNGKHLWAGLLFLAIGTFVAEQSLQYPLGTASHMGPGFFPLCGGILLALLGLATVLQTISRGGDEPVGAIDLLPILFLMGGVVVFALLIETAGLVPAVTALVLLSSYSRLLKKPLEVIATAVFVSVLSVILFIYVLKLPFAIF